MAALDFPNAPVADQLYAAPNGIIYQWNGVLWQPYGTTALPGVAAAPVYDTRNDAVLGSVVIPADDTIPQISEGQRLFQRTYTANFATNPIDVDVDVQMGSGGAGINCVLALFIDNGPDAVATKINNLNVAQAFMSNRLRWRGVLAAGPHTFEVRWANTAGGAYLSRNDSGRLFGGTLQATMTIAEIGQGAQGPVGNKGPDGNPGQGSRAWVNFTNGAVINASFNIQTVVKLGGGQYRVTLQNNAPNANFCALCSAYGGPGIIAGAYPESASTFICWSSNSVTQGFQDGNPYTAACFW